MLSSTYTQNSKVLEISGILTISMNESNDHLAGTEIQSFAKSLF